MVVVKPFTSFFFFLFGCYCVVAYTRANDVENSLEIVITIIVHRTVKEMTGMMLAKLNAFHHRPNKQIPSSLSALPTHTHARTRGRSLARSRCRRASCKHQ